MYRDYVRALNKRPADIQSLAEVPFLPIGFFKNRRVATGSFTEEIIFSSSGTGGTTSKHYLADLDLYRESFTRGFRHFYGDPADYCILALLPSYLERGGSSLVYMCQALIQQSGDTDSGFYLDDFTALYQLLLKKIEAGSPVILLGVTFALLDFAETYELPENQIIIMETGGMKGRRREMIRGEVHKILTRRLGVRQIHSEYGMTELMSQAYSKGEGRFRTPPWMKVMIRDTDDPLSLTATGKTGGVNVVDLANIDSCAFIETQDLGRWHENGEFEIMGRFDNSDIRGCNLMVI